MESLLKVDKSIIFHYCTIICDVLRPIDVIFKKTTQIVSDVLRFKFFLKWANSRLSVNVQKPKVFQLKGASHPRPPDQGLCPWTPLGTPPQTPYYGGLTLAFGGPPTP